MVSLVLNSLMDLLSDYLVRNFSHLTVYFFYAINLVLILAVTVLLFTIIFRILPDAIIRWRDAFIAAIFTGVLFMVGKLLISLYLGHSNIGLMYGAAASIMVILVWVYYSSIILYFGAEFTKTYAMRHGGGVRPNDNAVLILKRESRELTKEQGDAI
jgi:membrane protein